jgi:hypothetical protein
VLGEHRLIPNDVVWFIFPPKVGRDRHVPKLFDQCRNRRARLSMQFQCYATVLETLTNPNGKVGNVNPAPRAQDSKRSS